MCRSRSAALASQPQPARRNHHQHPSASPRRTTAAPSSRRSTLPTTSGSVLPSTNLPTSSTTPPLTDTHSHNKPSTTSSSSSSASSTLSRVSIRTSLTDNKPVIYSSREIQKATNNFLATRLSTSTASASWRCNGLRGKDTVVFQRALRGNPRAVKARLEDVSRGHHGSLVRLLGVSVGGTDTVFLVYEHVRGASLADCLRNARNPDFTLLATWRQRMQVAADVAQGIEYIHVHSTAGAAAVAAADVDTGPSTSAQTANGSGPLPRRRRRPPVHNRIKATSIMVFEQEPNKTEDEHAKAPKEPVFRAKICHFGASTITGELLGPDDDDNYDAAPGEGPGPGTPKRPTAKTPRRLIAGTRGYMAPELIAGSTPSQKSDVYAFGVVLLELLSGEEPLRYTYAGSDLTSVSLVDTARDVMGSDDAGEQWDEDERRSRIRRWVDRRLKDSYPLDIADKVLQVAVQCVAKDPVLRPDMTRVAGKMSKCFILSQQWAERLKPPTDFSVSMAPR